MATNIERGRAGEQLAADHLASAGYELLERNWRCRWGELDIVASEAQTLVICEVKTRSSEQFGSAQAAVDARKAARIRRLALLWLAEKRSRGESKCWSQLRFDVVGVLTAGGGEPVITHLRAAF